MAERLVQRANKVAYMEVEETYHRMKGFTSLATNKNPKEYTRQYVDELFETTDITGITPSIEFAFDQFVGNVVHDHMVNIIDNEFVGTDAVVSIMVVDFTKGDDVAGYPARVRKYSLIPSTEGDSLDAYTYSGAFRVNGSTIIGTATSPDDWLTATFVEGEVVEGEVVEGE